MLVTENDGNSFARNPLLSNSKGLREGTRIWVKLTDILVNPELNAARYGGTNSTLVEELKLSFSVGIRYNDFLPIIKKLPVNRKYDDGFIKFYELVDGFNRVTALKELGYTHYWFDVAEFGFDDMDPGFAQTTLAIGMNAPVPKVASTDKDLFTAVTRLVHEGHIEKDFEKIKSYIRNVAKVPPARAHNVSSQVAAATDTPNTLFIWSAAMIKNDTVALGITSHGKYDAQHDQHGWTVLEGYEPDAIMNAIAKFDETNKKSYFVGHTKTPDNSNNLADRRLRVKNNIEQRKTQLIALCEYYMKHEELPFELIGFLPQSETEDRTSLIQVK